MRRRTMEHKKTFSKEDTEAYERMLAEEEQWREWENRELTPEEEYDREFPPDLEIYEIAYNWIDDRVRKAEGLPPRRPNPIFQTVSKSPGQNSPNEGELRTFPKILLDM